MSDWVFLMVVVVLMVSQMLPRLWLHLVGFVGMGVLTWWAVVVGLDWPLIFLSGFGWVVHCGMLYYIRVLRRNPGV